MKNSLYYFLGIRHKASEFRSFLLVYFVTLKDVLPEKYFTHHLLLVESIFILSEKKRFSTASIEKVHDLLERYVFDFAVLYGESVVRVSYNLDLLIYLRLSVDRLSRIYVI